MITRRANLCSYISSLHLAVIKQEKTNLQCPEDNRREKEVLSISSVQMNPEKSKCENGKGNMKVKERFVKRVTKCGGRVEEERKEGTGGLEEVNTILSIDWFAGELTIKPLRMKSLPANEAATVLQPSMYN